MKLMSKLWALLVLVGVCSFGSQAFAKTNMEVLTCMNAALQSAPFTGTQSQRLKQARHLQAGTNLLIGKEFTPTTTEKSSAWRLCEGPTLQEQLDSANAYVDNLLEENSELSDRVAGLKTKLKNNDQELNKVKDLTQQQQHKLSDARFLSTVQWIVMVVLLALFLMACYRQHLDEFLENRHQRSIGTDKKRPVHSHASVMKPGDNRGSDSGS